MNHIKVNVSSYASELVYPDGWTDGRTYGSHSLSSHSKLLVSQELKRLDVYFTFVQFN